MIVFGWGSCRMNFLQKMNILVSVVRDNCPDCAQRDLIITVDIFTLAPKIIGRYAKEITITVTSGVLKMMYL